MKHTAVIILNYNNVPDTRECVNSILAFNTAPVKFIIVDNGSSIAETQQQLKSFCSDKFGEELLILDDESARFSGILPTCTLILSATNDGYARGNNKGLDVSYRDDSISHVIILNNDVVFESDIIPELVSYYSSLDAPGILTPLLRNRKKAEYNCARHFPDNWDIIIPFTLFNRNLFSAISKCYKKQMIIQNDPDCLKQDFFEIDVPSGSFMFIDKALFNSIGGFDQDTFLYYEEVIVCRRLRKKGVRNYCLPHLSAFHKGAGTTSKASSVFLQKCNIESADVYFKKESKLSFLQQVVWSLTKILWGIKFMVKRKDSDMLKLCLFN